MPGAVVASPDVSKTVAALMSGDVFAGLAFDAPDQRANALEAVLATFVDDGTRVAWVGNPLRSPLTIERFLLQVVGPEIDLRVERGPAELARLIAARRGSESRLLVVVQQPETINPETLEQLGALAGHLGGEAIQAQFLLVGSPTLRLPQIARAEIGQLLPSPGSANPPAQAIPAVQRRDVLPLILLLLAVSLGAVFSLAHPVPEAELSAVITPAVTPPAVASSVLGDTDKLKQRFDTFLAERASTLPPLSDAQKDRLFTEFLTHHRRE